MIADPEQIRRLAARADEAAEQLQGGAVTVAASTVTTWRSTAADRFRERLGGEVTATWEVAGQLGDLAQTLRDHARAVEAAWEALEQARAAAQDAVGNALEEAREVATDAVGDARDALEDTGRVVAPVVRDAVDIATRPLPGLRGQW